MILASLLTTLVHAQPQWENLLANNSLSKFEQRGGKAKYWIENGELVGETRPNTPNSFLCTKKIYGDFELTFEFKVNPELNSGVQIRSNSVAGYRDGVVHGYQAEIDPTDRRYTGGIYDESRRGWLDTMEHLAPDRPFLKKNDWNKYRILCEGSRIRTWINGVASADLTDDLTLTGFVAFQVHGVGDRKDPLQIRWRNIKIRDLGTPYQEKPRKADWLMNSSADLKRWQKASSKEAIEWKYINGALQIAPGKGSIQTVQPHESALIYLEFKVNDNGAAGQLNGNSGVYLQGRYEVQILNSAGQKPALDNCGAIYGVKAPDFNMALPAGEWQNYWIDFTAPRWDGDKKIANARATVRHNGTIIQKDVEIPGTTTSGAGESPLPAGLLLQDHGHPIEFRKIWILRR